MQKVDPTRRPRTLRELFAGAVQVHGALSPSEESYRQKVEEYLGTLGLSDESQIDMAVLAGELKVLLIHAVGTALSANPEIVGKFQQGEAAQQIVRILSLSLPSPDSNAARENRLTAAEQDTGFKLGQQVRTTGCGGIEGIVAGFARVNDKNDPTVSERKLVVQTNNNVYAEYRTGDPADDTSIGQDGQILVSPYRLTDNSPEADGNTAEQEEVAARL